MDAHTTSKMNRDPAAGPSFTGHSTHRRPGDDHHHRQSSATRLSPPRRQSPKPRDPRDRERDRIRDSSERDRDRERERGRDREWGKKESNAASVSRNRDRDDHDDDTGASDASNAETIVLPGKDGYSPSKVRRVRHERDADDHDSHAHSSPQIPTSKLPPKILTGPRASLSGSNPHSNAASEGPTRGILAKKNKIVDKSAHIARASSNHNSAASANHNPNNSTALAGPTPIPNGGSPPPAVVKRRRQSSVAASSSAPPQSASHAGSDSESESHLKAKEKLAKSSNPSSFSSSDKSLHKRKIIKCESDDEGEIPHKARRPRVSDNAQQPSAPPRSTKDSRPPKPEIPPPHSAINSPVLSTRSLSPTSKGLHRRSQSTNGSVIKKRRTPASMIHVSDYNSDHASDDETPQISTKPATARGVAERTESSTAKGPSKKNLDAHGQTLLARACAKGEYETVKLRLQERPEDLNVADYAGNTPLQIAAINGCADIVALLLEKGCNKHCLNYDKETPLLDAVDNGHVDVVRLLLDAGVNPRKANGQGEEPLARVTHETPNGPEIRELLIKAKATYRRNSEEPHTDDAAYQSEGTSVADSGHSRQTSINYDLAHVTSGSSRRQISARANKTSNRLLYIEANDKTLVSACSKGDKEMVNHLLNMSQKYRFSEAITAAARGGYDDIVDILLGWGAPADPKPIKNGPSETATPVLASIGQDNVKIMKLLLGQTSFDPTRHVKGKKYFEIARERQGRNWKEEEAILKRAYDNFKAKNPEQVAANEREGLAQTPSSSFDSLAIKTVGPSNKRPTSPGPSTSVDADDRKKSTSSIAATTTASTLSRDPESRDEKKTRDSLDSRRSVDGRKKKESHDSGSSNAPVTSSVSQKTKKRDKDKDKERDQDFKASDGEASPATAAAAATKKKVKRPVDSDAPVSSDGETSKPRRKLVSKGEMSQECEAQRVRRMSMASNASSLNQPSSPRDSDDAPPRSFKGEISERYHDRAKALKRDESHSGHDNPTPSAKRHRSSTSPSGARSESDREKVREEAETANISKRRRLDSETLVKDGRLEVPRKRVDKGSDSEKGASVDKESRPSKQSSSVRESTPVSKPAKVHKEVRESTPQNGAHLKLSDQLRLKKQQKTKAAKTLSVHDSDVEMKDVTVDNSYSRKEHSASTAGPDKKSRDTLETPQPKARRKLDENVDHESLKSVTESTEKEEHEIELAKRREAEKERWLAEEKEKERIREEREVERKAEADRIVAERQERERKAEEEVQRAREEARAQAELEERRKAEAEAKRKAEQEAKRKAEAERRAAEEARLKAEEEARQRRLAEEKAAEEARLKAEAEKRRQRELQEQREREREAEERRQREIREQAEREEAERAERAERERERMAKEKQEQELARIERLPAVLRWLETSADPQRPSFAEKFRVMQGVRWDTMDAAKDGTEEGREQWVLNIQVALLLGDKDLSLSKYPSWQRIPASHIAKISIWRVENDRYSLSSPRYSELGRELDGYYNAQNDLASVCQERLNRMKSEAEERFLAMDLFFVKVSDFLTIVPSIPHLKDLKLSVEYRELPDCKEKLKGIWCGAKWRSDPGADKYKGFAPGRRYFVNGAFVVGDFL